MGQRKLIARVKRGDLPPGTQKRVDYPPFGVLLVNLAGVAYAIDDTCNHAGESLAKGELDGCKISCPAHGYLFDVRTGHLVEPVGLCDDQRTFEVTIEADDFVVYDDVLQLLTPGSRSTPGES
jgi:3-phenylpropionate/trans-cinnamate dioxygenase ferredoxin subunit